MAIIACPECGQKVSTTAKACPGCGHGVAQAIKSKRTAYGVLALLAGVMVIAVIAGLSDKQEPNEKPQVANPIPMIGDVWYTKGTPIGCRDSKDLDRLGDLARQNDNAAFATFFVRQSLAGRCTKLDEGVQVYIESSSFLGSPCVRPKGDPFCLYVLTVFLQNTPPQK